MPLQYELRRMMYLINIIYIHRNSTPKCLMLDENYNRRLQSYNVRKCSIIFLYTTANVKVLTRMYPRMSQTSRYFRCYKIKSE